MYFEQRNQINRNLGGNDAIDEICRCLVDPSDLLNHELAYCLGQMQDTRALPKLMSILEDKSVAPITRFALFCCVF